MAIRYQYESILKLKSINKFKFDKYKVIRPSFKITKDDLDLSTENIFFIVSVLYTENNFKIKFEEYYKTNQVEIDINVLDEKILQANFYLLYTEEKYNEQEIKKYMWEYERLTKLIPV
jgi:hypothetical protein